MKNLTKSLIRHDLIEAINIIDLGRRNFEINRIVGMITVLELEGLITNFTAQRYQNIYDLIASGESVFIRTMKEKKLK